LAKVCGLASGSSLRSSNVAILPVFGEACDLVAQVLRIV
jgi:hypothetical protein